MDVDDAFWELVASSTQEPCIHPENGSGHKKRKGEVASLSDSEGEDDDYSAPGFLSFFDPFVLPSVVPTVQAEKEDDTVESETELRTNYVNAVFNLSTKAGFLCDFESFVAAPLGKVSRLLGKKLSVEKFGYSGKCDVQVSGSAHCLGQHSFAEVQQLSRRMAWEFMDYCRQDVGVNKLRFTVANLSAFLPWHVNLVKMKRFNPEITFEPQFSEWAVVKYEDLQATINLSAYGRMRIMCLGDCPRADPNMPKACEAVERLGNMTRAYRIRDSVRADSPCAETTPTAVEIPSVVCPPKDSAPEFVPRRSDRLLCAQLTMEEDDETPDRGMPFWMNKRLVTEGFSLDQTEQRVFVLLQNLAVELVNRNSFVRTLQSIAAAAQRKENSEKFVGLLVRISGWLGVDGLCPAPVQPIPDPPPPRPMFAQMMKTTKGKVEEKKSKKRCRRENDPGSATTAANLKRWSEEDVLQYLDHAVDRNEVSCLEMPLFYKYAYVDLLKKDIVEQLSEK